MSFMPGEKVSDQSEACIHNIDQSEASIHIIDQSEASIHILDQSETGILTIDHYVIHTDRKGNA